MIDPLIRRPFSLTLQGQRVCLHFAQDIQSHELWKSIQRDRIKRAQIWPGFNELSDLQQYIQNASKANPAQEVVYIISIPNNNAVGTIHIHTLNYFDHKLELGYWIENQFEGQGFVSESIKLIEQEIRQLGFHRIEIKCPEQNKESIRVAEKNNYQLECVAKHDCVVNGEFRSTCHFAKVFDEKL